MKTTRLTTYWDAEQVIAVIELINELQDALAYTYRDEIEQYQQQQWIERQKDNDDNLDMFDDNMDF